MCNFRPPFLCKLHPPLTGRNIVISPATSHTEDEFLASLDKINSRFSTTLERLAK